MTGGNVGSRRTMYAGGGAAQQGGGAATGTAERRNMLKSPSATELRNRMQPIMSAASSKKEEAKRMYGIQNANSKI